MGSAHAKAARTFMMDIVSTVIAGVGVGLGIDAAADRFAKREPILSLRPWTGLPRYSELATMLAGGGISIAALVWAPPALVLFTLLLGWLLLALAAIDLKTFLLPDVLNAGVLLLGAVMVGMTRADAWVMHVAGAVIGYGVLWAVETAYRRLKGIDGLGRGDAKLLGALGIWVGALGLPPVLLIASLSGLLAALVLAVKDGRGVSGQSAIAFGPWIALGGYAVWLMQQAAAPLPGPG